METRARIHKRVFTREFGGKCELLAASMQSLVIAEL